MNPHRIIYTDHAAERMVARGVRPEDVRFVLSLGDITPAENGCLDARGTVRKRELSVIFVKVGTDVRIVTVQWID